MFKPGIIIILTLAALGVQAQPTNTLPYQIQGVTAYTNGYLHSPSNFFDVNIGNLVSQQVDEVFSTYNPTNFALLEQFRGVSNVANISSSAYVNPLGTVQIRGSQLVETNMLYWHRYGPAESNKFWAVENYSNRLSHLILDMTSGGMATGERKALAYLADVQKQNARGSVTQVPIDSFIDAGGGLWTNASGWYFWGTITNNAIIMTTNDLIRSPSLTTGMSEFKVWLDGGNNNDLGSIDSELTGTWTSNRVSGFLLGPGLTSVSIALSSPIHANPYMQFRYTGKMNPLPMQENDYLTITNLAWQDWANAAFVGSVNDNAGLIMEVDDNITESDRAAINQRTLNMELTTMQQRIDGITPNLVGIDLAGNQQSFGNLWTAEEEGHSLVYRYIGQDVFYLANGGQAYPNILRFWSAETNIRVNVIGHPSAEPMIEYSTNTVDWTLITAYTTTWPTLDDGAVDINFAPIEASPIWYRAVVTNEMSMASAAHLLVDLDMHGNKVRDYESDLVTVVPTNIASGVVLGAYSNNSARGVEFRSSGGTNIFTFLGNVPVIRRGTSTYTVWNSDNFNAALYISASAFQGAMLNYARRVSVPTSATAPGVGNNYAVDATNVYFYVPEDSRWLRVPGSTSW